MINSIDKVFRETGDIPLFYIESGSRLWGIASPDSDYDVRGIHLQSKEKYFDYKTHRDIIEVMDGDFDFVSYGIDKMFGLLAKSNPTVFEWIRAHITYLNLLPDWDLLQKDIIANYDFKTLYYHYISIAKTHFHLMETERRFTYKVVFYSIRGLFTAELSRQGILPAILIDNLFQQFSDDNDVLKIAKENLEIKKQHPEKQEIANADKPKILATLLKYLQQLEAKAPQSTNDPQKLESILTDYAISIKSKYYGGV